jgi:putative protein-disulfide isomerase
MDTSLNRPTLHYLHDPLCGWCYGAAPLIRAAREHATVIAHAGGMMIGAQRRAMSPALRQVVLAHDQQIARRTGQPFGAAYTEGLLRDASAVLDSEPPTTAVLAAEQVAQRGLDMLARLQIAHYVEGLRLTDTTTLIDLAAWLDIDRARFAQAFEALRGAPTQAHIEASRALMARVGARGFPTVVLERQQGFVVVDLTPFHQRVDAWAAWLQQQTPAVSHASNDANVALCTPEGCPL